MKEGDIYTYKPTRAEQRKLDSDEYQTLVASKKMKSKLVERGQHTNKDKLKNKPFMMTIDKKAKQNNQYKQLRVKQTSCKRQLGHIHKGLKGNIKSKKRALKR